MPPVKVVIITLVLIAVARFMSGEMGGNLVMPNPFDFVMFVLLTWGVIDQAGWTW